MATREYQCSFQNSNNLPTDRYVNVLYFDDVGSIASRQAISDAIALAYRTRMLSLYAGDIKELRIKVYPLGFNPGGPEVETAYAFVPTGQAAPHEIALCLSYYSVNNQPRSRGRIYLGPFNVSQVGPRPSPTTQAAALGLGSDLKAIASATWKIRSRTPVENLGDITNWWVDNAWDTMRSRGPDPTARITAP